MTPLAVEVSQLVEVVWVSLLAGIGVITCFSLVILGTARMAAARRAGREAAALGYGVLALAALLAFAAVVVFGIQVMLAK